MLKKICSFCKKASYSSSNDYWRCPYCGKDISRLPAQNPGNNKPTKVICLSEIRRKQPFQ